MGALAHWKTSHPHPKCLKEANSNYSALSSSWTEDSVHRGTWYISPIRDPHANSVGQVLYPGIQFFLWARAHPRIHTLITHVPSLKEDARNSAIKLTTSESYWDYPWGIFESGFHICRVNDNSIMWYPKLSGSSGRDVLVEGDSLRLGSPVVPWQYNLVSSRLESSSPAPALSPWSPQGIEWSIGSFVS